MAKKKSTNRKTTNRKLTKNKASNRKENAVQRYYRETVGELRKVTWPTRQEAINLTSITLVVIVAMSAFLGTLDYVFNRLFALILSF